MRLCQLKGFVSLKRERIVEVEIVGFVYPYKILIMPFLTDRYPLFFKNNSVRKITATLFAKNRWKT